MESIERFDRLPTTRSATFAHAPLETPPELTVGLHDGRRLMVTSLRGSDPLRSRPSALEGSAGAMPSSATAARQPLFRPRSRSRVRLLAGVALLAAAVIVNLAVYRRLDERVPVLQLARDVPAGAQLVEGDLRQVEASTSSDINLVAAAELSGIIGETAKVRLVSGSMLVHEALQASPLVGAGSSVVALTVPNGELPAGLRERSRVLLVLIAGQSTTQTSTSIPARVVTLPQALAGQSDRVTLSFEMLAADAANVAAAERVRVVLIDPGIDPAYVAAPSSGAAPSPSVAPSSTGASG